MKRLVLCCFLLAAQGTFAQEHQGGHEATGHKGGGERGNLEIWKWANFLILAGALGYVLVKKGGPFFQSRSEQIRKDIDQAGSLRAEAEARAAAVDQRLAGLDADIEDLRKTAGDQIAHQGERIRRETGAHLAKIQTRAGQEIEAALKTARLEVKRHSAQRAIGLARLRIAERMGPDQEDLLVGSFAKGLERVRQP